MSDIDVLETVLAKDAALLAAVSPEQLSAPTPCPEYDVQALVNQVTPGVRGGG
ncbi:MAG: maleylpyruvate isomerase N-terminal domain-containing protein [Pseudonocardiaceae bacterium]